jgi:hypothetical protein
MDPLHLAAVFLIAGFALGFTLGAWSRPRGTTYLQPKGPKNPIPPSLRGKEES